MTPIAEWAAALSGRYTVEREIGQGGMATVYLAHDVRHERKVALKLLKPELGAVLGADRFLNEIRVTANLHHPNLLPLFDSGEAGGLLFYVMPFVEGETLRHRLDREKQLPVNEAVRITVAVASALEYAHEHGVIHRDLKPENILLQAGQPVVSDFGIALAVRNAGGTRVTQTGLSLGTPQYMSPEQATGDRVIDGRSDVYSLAAVAYEMLTGEPPHTGSTAQAIIARVLTERPRPVRGVRSAVPEHIALAVDRALEKLPADRWSTAREFADALQGRGGIVHGAARVASPRTFAMRVLPWGVAAALGVVALMSGADSRPVVSHVARFLATPPDSIGFQPVQGTALLFTPDGQSVVYAGRAPSGGLQLYQRPLSSLVPRAIAGTDGVIGQLFVSPDGRRVGYVADRLGEQSAAVARGVALDGSGATTVALGTPRGVRWLPDGNFIIGTQGSEGLMRVSASGAAPVPLTTIDTARGELLHRDPLLLPDGRTVIFRVTSRDSDALGVLLLDRHEERRLEGDAYTPLGVLDGFLVFGRRDGTIAAAPFDRDRTTSVADAVTLVEGVFWQAPGGVAAALSRDGSLAYVPGAPVSNLVVVDERGTVVSADTIAGQFLDPAYSPDGRQVVITLVSPDRTNARVWVYDVRARVARRMPDRPQESYAPAWSADGRRIAFVTPNDSGRPELWWMPADKSAPEERLLSLPQAIGDVVFSPDGRYAVLRVQGGPGLWADLMLLPLSGEGARVPTPLVATPFRETMPAISPDSRWLAYVSDESGAQEVYVRAFPGSGASIRVSRRGGFEPQWRNDGRLFYRSGDSLWLATLSTTPGLEVVARDALFEIGPRTSAARAQYTVDPSGRRFFFQRRGASGRFDIVVVTNWMEEVRQRLAPAQRQ